MAIKYGKKRKNNNVLVTIITGLLLTAVFLITVSSFYISAEEEAHEMLHMQTKQIKDDLVLQIKSDRENLVTMANFAAKLYADGESYDLMFESFKPIGLFTNIGILNPDNVFVTKKGSIDLNGKISFEEEAARGSYISGRVPDLTRDGAEILRSAVPIKVNEEVVGVLYGVILLETIGEKYNNMAKELDAQLFVYNKRTGKFIIDTISSPPGELSQLKDREYNEGYSYEQLISTDKGFTSFKSIRTGENLYVHYSTIEDFDWVIMLARYESQVFAATHSIFRLLLVTFLMIVAIIVLYLLFVLKKERNATKTASKASEIRQLLLEINQQQGNVLEALKTVRVFSRARSAFLVDTDGEDYDSVSSLVSDVRIEGDERKYLIGELLRYSADLNAISNSNVGVMSIVPGKHLIKTNPDLYNFFKKHDVREICFANTIDNNNHVSIIGVINPERSYSSRVLLEEIAICFSIAIFNKNHLNKTEMAATTDSLTGAMNRVSYKKDITVLDEEKPSEFACIYIDVNELHIRNNKHGHAAGDAMLIYIANTLKDVFFGHKIYRMGGDEFLVFTKGIPQEQVNKNIDTFIEQLTPKGYKVAIGMSYREQHASCEVMVREAEVRMYEAKAQYYQNKENISISSNEDKSYSLMKTGIKEIDAMISVLKDHYNGIYRVSLEDDSAHRILMPAYLGYSENENNFSKLLVKYIDDTVNSDFHRAVTSFLNYDALRRHISEGNIPKIRYKKTNGETVELSVYSLDENKNNVNDTLWVFSKC